MLSVKEIEKLLKKGSDIMPDLEVIADAETWDLTHKRWCGRRIAPQTIGLVYSYIKNKYSGNETLEDIERALGIAMEYISFCLRELEEHGWITITRGTKPFQYRAAK